MYVPPGSDDLTSNQNLDKWQKFKVDAAAKGRKAYPQVHGAEPLKTGYRWVANKPYGDAWSLGSMYVFLLLDNGGFPRSRKEIKAWLTDSDQQDHSSIPTGKSKMFKSVGPGVIGLDLKALSTGAKGSLFGDPDTAQLIKHIVLEGSYMPLKKDPNQKILDKWSKG